MQLFKGKNVKVYEITHNNLMKELVVKEVTTEYIICDTRFVLLSTEPFLCQDRNNHFFYVFYCVNHKANSYDILTKEFLSKQFTESVRERLKFDEKDKAYKILLNTKLIDKAVPTEEKSLTEFINNATIDPELKDQANKWLTISQTIDNNITNYSADKLLQSTFKNLVNSKAINSLVTMSSNNQLIKWYFPFIAGLGASFLLNFLIEALTQIIPNLR